MGRAVSRLLGPLGGLGGALGRIAPRRCARLAAAGERKKFLEGDQSGALSVGLKARVGANRPYSLGL